MHQFKAAQPALLYLSPACILFVTFTALLRGELQAFWRYADEDEDAKKNAKEDLSATKEPLTKADGQDNIVGSSTSVEDVNDSAVKRR